MAEIKIPKYKEVVLEFTASQVQNDVEIYLPYLDYKRDRSIKRQFWLFMRKINYLKKYKNNDW